MAHAGGTVERRWRPRFKAALARYPSFDHVVELIRSNRDVKLLVEVETGVRLVSYQPGRIEFTPAENSADAIWPNGSARRCSAGPATAGA